MRQIILDTETTGLSATEGHQILEIAGIELINRRPTGRRYHQYIKPTRAIDAGAAAVHGLTNAFLADKPLFPAIAEELLAFLIDAELVIHNAPFDISFINAEFSRAGAHFKPIATHCKVLDTLVLARKKHPGQQNSLDALCRRYKVDNSNRELHGALLDADLLMQVYLAMTGGQTTLFGPEIQAEAPKNSVSNSPVTTITTATANNQAFNLKVIYADAEECDAHEARLEAIRKVSGECLWG